MDNKQSKLVHGLSHFHLAPLAEDTKQAVEYETPEELEGAVSVSVTPNTNTSTKYADNRAFGVLNKLGDIEVEIAVVDLPQHIQTMIYNQKSENGVVFANSGDEPTELALGFKAEVQGGGSRYYWLLKGTAQLNNTEHSTSEDTIESQDTTVTMTFTPLRHNGNWKAQLDSIDVTPEQWFANVVYDAETAQALQGDTGGTEE